MSVANKALIFLVLTVAIGWTALVSGWIAGYRDVTAAGVLALIFVLSPAAAALSCTLAFERGRRMNALGLRFRPNWWWLWALLIPVGITALSIAVTASVSGRHLQGIDGVARQMADWRHETYAEPRSYLIRTAGYIGLVIAGNTVFTLTEELGWRGYLYHLWRPFGFWRASVGIGLVWGVWHWPMIYLFGLNYPDHRLLGLALFPVVTMLEAPIMTLVRDRGRSVWAACIFHATLNAVLILTMVMVDAPKFPWDATGIGTVTAFAICTLIIAIARKGASDAWRGEPDRGPLAPSPSSEM